MYLTLKLTTHMLPYPKTHPKTHNSQRFGWQWHKEVVPAQGAAVGATVGIGRSLEWFYKGRAQRALTL